MNCGENSGGMKSCPSGIIRAGLALELCPSWSLGVVAAGVNRCSGSAFHFSIESDKTSAAEDRIAWYRDSASFHVRLVLLRHPRMSVTRLQWWSKHSSEWLVDVASWMSPQRVRAGMMKGVCFEMFGQTDMESEIRLEASVALMLWTRRVNVGESWLVRPGQKRSSGSDWDNTGGRSLRGKCRSSGGVGYCQMRLKHHFVNVAVWINNVELFGR
jgi:hypothetical protein